MENIISDNNHFKYHGLSVYAPAGCGFLAVFCLALTIFTSTGLFEFIMLVFSAAVASWAATLFFERVDLELNHLNDTVVMSHTRLLRTGLTTEKHEYRLSQLTHVWLEGITGRISNSRVTLGFNGQWVPLSVSYSQRHVSKKLSSKICTWLQDRGYTFETGEGWLPGQSWKTFIAEAQEEQKNK